MAKTLLQLKMNGSEIKRQVLGGSYGNMVDELYRKCHVKAADFYNPCSVVNVLLADDDVLSNMALKKIVESSGNYRVFPFYNGLSASEFYERRHADVNIVILDVEMPERNGVETAEWIRKFETAQQLHHVSIIGLTGYEAEDVKKQCLQSGMNLVLTKPIRRAELIQVMKQFVVCK